MKKTSVKYIIFTPRLQVAVGVKHPAMENVAGLSATRGRRRAAGLQVADAADGGGEVLGPFEDLDVHA